MPDEQNQAYNDATQLVVNAVKRAIRTRWETAFRDGFKQKMLDMVLEATIPQVAALEKMVAGLAASFLSDRTGHKVTQLDDSSRTSQDDIRQGIINAFITGRAAVKDGVSADEAIAQSLNQLLTFVDTGAETAKIKQSQNSLIEAGWQRYKRVAHPGESESGSCALCLIASTRVYYIEDLLPIHTNCHCDVDTIQDGDITIVDGKEYVGLRDLKIPEDMMTIGPHANPDSMQTRLKTYLQDMDKRQFQSGLQAWEQTISVDMSPTNSGGLPRLQYKSQNDKTLNVSMAAPKARKTQPSKPTEVKTLSRRAGLTRTIEDFKAKYPNLQMKDFENSVQLLRNRFKRLDPDNLKAVEETMRDFLLGLDRVYSISPKAASMNVYQTNKGTTIKVNEVQGAFGMTTGYYNHPKSAAIDITLNEKWARDPAGFQEIINKAVTKEHFHPGSENAVGYQTGVHEGAHGLDYASGGLTMDEKVLYNLLAETYVKVGPAVDFATYNPNGKAEFDAFETWVAKEMSGYAFAKSPDGKKVLYAPEAVATSVADVLERGEKATNGSKAIYNYWLNKLDEKDLLEPGVLDKLIMEIK